MKYLVLILVSVIYSQQKIVNEDVHTWTSINSMMRFSEKWGGMLDLHHRRSDGVNLPSFSLIRLGVNFHPENHLSINAGLSIMQVSTPFSLQASSMEYRPHIQAMYNKTILGAPVISRMRFESRWRENVAENSFIRQFRYRYLLNITMPLVKKEFIPKLVMADEIFLQSGDKTDLNPFDQNRMFIGIRQKISHDFSFDLGYMNVFQQLSSGNVFNSFHTIRLFFYWTPDFRARKEQLHHPMISE